MAIWSERGVAMDGVRRAGLLRALVRLTLPVGPAGGAYLSPGAPRTTPGQDFSSNLLHVSGDGVCPRCLRWLETDDIVRRTVYGPLEHEACPGPAEQWSGAGARRAG